MYINFVCVMQILCSVAAIIFLLNGVEMPNGILFALKFYGFN